MKNLYLTEIGQCRCFQKTEPTIYLQYPYLNETWNPETYFKVATDNYSKCRAAWQKCKTMQKMMGPLVDKCVGCNGDTSSFI